MLQTIILICGVIQYVVCSPSNTIRVHTNIKYACEEVIIEKLYEDVNKDEAEINNYITSEYGNIFNNFLNAVISVKSIHS